MKSPIECTSICIESALLSRVEVLAKSTGHSKDQLIQEAIIYYLNECEELLGDSITSDESEIAIPQSHIDELDKRLKDYRANPGKLLTLDEFQARIEDMR
ncbi:MAG: addiction module protein [Nitrospirae bacterium]|nr:addiction module protein [Nitrospirota bacterium]MBF0593126.1 addiction module protein [Nitrospirota bacterium]